MKILHLGFEDPLRPGSGGGALRNHEVNRRLVEAGHEVEVVAARYPGAETRHDQGVLYRHRGIGAEYFASILSYQAMIPAIVKRATGDRKPDLLVEEFCPPWSSIGVPRWSSTPTVGMVQGYFAAEKQRQYHVPFGLLRRIERWGTRGHTDLIALSEDLADALRAEAPAADVRVIGMGIDHDEIRASFDPAVDVTQPLRIVFLGRLEIDQKGLDLLLEACEGLLQASGAELVLAGDGRDASAVRQRFAASSFASQVRLPGRVVGTAKWQLLASAQLCVLPSRYETFGLSALEALACGTPVVGFDIDSLRATVPPGCGELVEPFQTGALREAIRALLDDPQRCRALGQTGRRHAEAYSWDAVAAAQEQAYLEIVSRGT